MIRPTLLMILGLPLIGCGSSPPTHSTSFSPESNQPSSTPTEPKNWVTDREANPIDGTVRLTLLAHATDKSGGALVVRFTGKKLEAYIITGGVVDDENANVRMKFDDKPPIKQTWSRSADYKAVFSPDPFGLVSRLQHSSQFYIEYHPFQRVPETITFKVAGLSSVLPEEEMAAEKKKLDDVRVADAVLRSRIWPHVHECSQKKNDGGLMYPGQWCWTDPSSDDFQSDLVPFSTREEAIRNAMEMAHAGNAFKK